MPVVKVDMTGVDAAESREATSFEQPDPGRYRCEVVSLDTGYAKTDSGQPDESRPMLILVLRPHERLENGEKKKGNWGQLWVYLSFSKEAFPRKKMDQALQALGVLSGTKRKASFDPEKMKGKKVVATVYADTYNGQYKAKVGDIFADSLGDDDPLDLSDNDEDFSDEEFDSEEEMEDEAEGEGEDEDEDSGLYTAEEIEGMDATEIRSILREGYDFKPAPRFKVDKLREILLEKQAEYCESEGIENPAAASDEDDEEMVEESELLTEAQLKAMSPAELKKVAKDFDLTVGGKTKSKVVAEILEAQGADDEEPF